MFKLSIPGILGSLVLTLNTFIDSIFAGRYIGETALAGILLAGPFVGIIQGFADFIGTGSASILSRAIGSGDVKTQSKIFGNLIMTSVVISFFITVIGYGFAQELITLMGGSGEVALEGTKYLKVYTIGSIIFIIGKASGEVISSEGQIKWTVISMWVFVTLNVLLDYIFVAVYHWGNAELALATVIAMIAASLVNLAYFILGKSIIPVNLKKLAIAIDLLPEIFSVGVSSLLFPVVGLIQEYIVFNSISYYGTNSDIAFLGAAGDVSSLAFIPVSGIAQALEPVIGMNYGAKKQKRIKQAYFIFTICGIILLILIWLPLQISPRTFLRLILPSVNFTENDAINFRILTILGPISALSSFSNSLFISLGKGKTVFGVLLLRMIVLNIPMVLLFSRIYGVRGVYSGLLIADIIFMLIVIILTVLEFKNLSQLKVEEEK